MADELTMAKIQENNGEFVKLGKIAERDRIRKQVEKLRDKAWAKARKRRNELDEVLIDTHEMGMVEACDLISDVLEGES